MPRPPKKPSKKDLHDIEILAGYGLTQQQIADLMDICVETLVKYAKVQLRRGKAKVIAKVAQTCAGMATSGRHPAMTRFFLTTQGGPSWQVQHHLPEEVMEFMREQDDD